MPPLVRLAATVAEREWMSEPVAVAVDALCTIDRHIHSGTALLSGAVPKWMRRSSTTDGHFIHVGRARLPGSVA